MSLSFPHVLELVLIFMLAGTGAAQTDSQSTDTDGDGLPDSIETRLIAKFAPTLMISADECDGRPAEFVAGVAEPQVRERNGTLYARATPAAAGPDDAPGIEIQYFHLWGRDCGRGSHTLDAEHVSVRIRRVSASGGDSDWQATHWYAAAHEGTVCDASNGATASAIGAEHRGATVWVSSGKHASYLDPGLCRLGCGSDRCSLPAPSAAARIINIGERQNIVPETGWVLHRSWPLGTKLEPDFTSAVLERIDRADGTPGRAGPFLQPGKAFILGANSAYSALETADRETTDALGVGGERAVKGAGTGLKYTGKGVFRALKAVGNKLGLTKTGEAKK